MLYAQDRPEISEAPLAEILEDDGEDLSADGEAPDAETEEAEESLLDGSLSRENQRIEMEIKTSTLPELAAWCRSLGLSEGGTREELSRRLRSYYQLPVSGSSVSSNQRQITIESAQTTEYFKIEVTDEEYARLAGNVRLSLIENGAVHKIKAQEIIFNRTRNIMTARGDVVYEKESGETIETFRGESITVNIDDWSSVFLGGDSEHTLDSDGTSYLFSGLVISRTSEDVTILNKARITNAKNEYALWSVTASKLWLLPGSDFAFFNAILRVGEIPLMYIPFFYYPVDEIVFHPVIGYRAREGGFVQTTTYILGHPKADSSDESSITRILGDSASMEKERHGIFLRNTGRRIINPEETSLKALFDYYANLGTYIGLDLSTPGKGFFEPLGFSLGVGVTRTLTLTGIGYTPYAPNYDGSSDWNHSNLFSNEVPFRYRMNLQGGAGTPITKLANISWSLPYYSDPYVDRDFLDRSENMDWFNLAQQGTQTD
jgi:lipopolysaccharide assembly outer membrane protein LptD (OstA)